MTTLPVVGVSGQVTGSERPGLAAVDRADAGGRSRRHDRHQRRQERCADRRVDPCACRTRRWRPARSPSAQTDRRCPESRTRLMKTIGIIGGGQLGLMIAEQAHVLGVRAVALDPAPDAPAFRVCDDHIVAAYNDAEALERLCRMSDAVTYEFENVPGDILIPLSEKYNIPQGYRPLYDSQDRFREKTNARDHGLRTPGFAAVDDEGVAACRRAGAGPSGRAEDPHAGLRRPRTDGAPPRGGYRTGAAAADGALHPGGVHRLRLGGQHRHGGRPRACRELPRGGATSTATASSICRSFRRRPMRRCSDG